MAQIEQKSDDSQLHWFWKLTTKWWFFPMFYLSLGLVFTFVAIIKAYSEVPYYLSRFQLHVGWFALVYFLIGIILLPIGFMIFFAQNLSESYVIQIGLAYVLLIVNMSAIIYYNSRKDGIPKWLIIEFILFLILAFLG